MSGWGKADDNPFVAVDYDGGAPPPQFSETAPAAETAEPTPPPPAPAGGADYGVSPAPAHESFPQSSAPGGGASWGGAAAATPAAGAAGDGDLAAREAELRRREEQLSRREEEVRRQMQASGIRPKNWPPCYPILHHDISADIPYESQTFVKQGYIIWIATAVGYFYAWVCSLASVIAGLPEDGASSNMRTFIFHTLESAVGIWASFYFWYGGMYLAAQHDSVIRYAFFFLHFMIHMAWAIWTAVGAPFFNWPIGFINMISVMQENKAVGFLYLICAVLWSVISATSVLLFGVALRKFRSKGGVEELNRQRKDAQRTAQAAATVAQAANSVQRAV